MQKTRLPLVMLLGLAALALLSGCAGAAPTPAEAMREAKAAVPAVVTVTAADLMSPTPSQTPTPTETPTPTPTPTPEATPEAGGAALASDAEVNDNEPQLVQQMRALGEQYRQGSLKWEELPQALEQVLTGTQIEMVVNERVILADWLKRGLIEEKYIPYAQASIERTVKEKFDPSEPKIYNLIVEFGKKYMIGLGDLMQYYLRENSEANWDPTGFWRSLQVFAEQSGTIITVTFPEGSVILHPDGSYTFGAGYNNSFLRSEWEEGWLNQEWLVQGKYTLSRVYGPNIGWNFDDHVYPQTAFITLQPAVSNQGDGCIVSELKPLKDSIDFWANENIPYEVTDFRAVDKDKCDAYLPQPIFK